MKTLVTDGFADDEWLDADDRKLLEHTIRQLAEKYIARREAAPAAMPEPPEGTFWLDPHPTMGAEVWASRARGGIVEWFRTGSSVRYKWMEVRTATRGRVLTQLFPSPSFPVD